MKSKKFLWIAAAILLAGMISSCEELGVEGIEDLFQPGPGPNPPPTPAGISVDFNEVTADGKSGAYTTTALSLHFSEAIAGLEEKDITLTGSDGTETSIKKDRLEGEGPSYTLYVSGIEAEGEVSVAVSKTGYVIQPPSITVSVHFGSGTPTTVVFSGLEANAGKTGTTYLTLTFGEAVALEGKDIYLNPGSTGAGKGELTGNGKEWKLDVSGITKSGDVSVTVTKAGTVFEPSTKTVTVLGNDVTPPQPPGGGGQDEGGGSGGETIGEGTEVTFTGVQADSGEGYTTTALSLHFDKAITGLNEGDIKLTPIGDANKNITTRTLEGLGPSYTLYVTGVMVEGFVKVEVSKKDYAVSGNPRTVAVHTAGSDQKTATTVDFKSLSADGESKNKKTEKLTLTFSQSVDGLSTNDIYLNPGVTGAQKGNLSGGTTSYDLTVSGIETGGKVSVTVTKTGYAFQPTTQGATVYSGTGKGDDSLTAVTLDSVVVSKTSNENTTELTLTFSDSVTGLTANHITITSPNRTTVKNGDLEGGGLSYTLPVSVTKEETVTVAVSNPEGYVISDSSPSVPVYYYLIEHTDNAYKNPSIKAKFMIDAEGTDGVTAAFNALSAYIKTDEFSSANNVIKLGDWIDLEGGLTVDKYLIHYAINMGNTSMYPTFAFEERMMLRLIVVGINSFKNLNGNDNTPHVVFHFQNVPLSSLEMNVMNKGVRPTNAGGYPASTLRRYLTKVEDDDNSGKFLAGLINAGVPEEVLWAPVRVVAVDKESTAKISDWLWLPTLWEMTGNNKASIWATYEVNQETSENQASLAYYSGRKNPNRIKYDIYIGVIRRNYWLASPYPHSDVQFCTVNSYDRYGSPGFLEARQVAGVAPAFCVQ